MRVAGACWSERVNACEQVQLLQCFHLFLGLLHIAWKVGFSSGAALAGVWVL
jgi:hypothetical protein